MKQLFAPGSEKSYTKVVSAEDIARFESGTVHEVYATFAIARDAEWAGRLFVLDMKEDDEEGDLSFGDMLHDDSHNAPEDDMMRNSVEGTLKNMLSALDAREQEIIKLYFGLEGHETHTLEEIGEKLDLTRERVRQIKEKCLERLKKKSDISLLDNYPLK